MTSLLIPCFSTRTESQGRFERLFCLEWPRLVEGLCLLRPQLLSVIYWSDLPPILCPSQGAKNGVSVWAHPCLWCLHYLSCLSPRWRNLWKDQDPNSGGSSKPWVHLGSEQHCLVKLSAVMGLLSMFFSHPCSQSHLSDETRVLGICFTSIHLDLNSHM